MVGPQEMFVDSIDSSETKQFHENIFMEIWISSLPSLKKDYFGKY